MAHELSRAVFVFLSVWFVGVTVAIVYNKFSLVMNGSDIFVLVGFAILSIIAGAGVYGTEPN
jgi:hypothetical protein